MNEPLLEVKELGLSFSGVKALDGVSAQIQQGQITAVIGPNGAGKTSLFNCLSGVYSPTAGEVIYKGSPINAIPSHKRARQGIARMFQNLALFDTLSVLENLLVGRHHLYTLPWWHHLIWTPRMAKQEIAHRAYAEEIIDFLNLERYRKTLVGSLPYGVLKRVELGRALCMEPDLLLLDEPAAGLNQEETEDLARYLLDIKEELKITQVLIEHELGLVLDLADHIIVLDFGQKIAEGTANDIRNNPRVMEAYLGDKGVVAHG